MADPPVNQEIFTTFTPWQKRFLTVFLFPVNLASPLSATAYVPLIPLLSKLFSTSLEAINLTVTIYVVFQAISPSIFAPYADLHGRRPVLLLTYCLYTVASLGLALNDTKSYAGLLVLRGLQSLGASAGLSLTYGVVSDLCRPAERGTMVGPILAMGSLGVCVGPVVGGWIAFGSGGVVWVFWALAFFGATVTVAIALVFPETGRNIVGNGSIPATGWHRSWWTILIKWVGNRHERFRSPISTSESGTNLGARNETSSRWRAIIPQNPFFGIRIMFYKDTALILFMASIFYATYYCVQTSIPVIFESVYGFNDLQIGLAYLPGGFGVIIGAFCTGRLMDHNYKVIAARLGHKIDKIKGDDINIFPIEKARTRLSLFLLAIHTATLIGYGWATSTHPHCAVPLVLQALLGLLINVFNATYSTLLVDTFPANASAAAATGNLARCTMTGIFIAVLQPAVKRLGRNWYFTLLGVLSGGGGVIVVLLLRWRGRKWRLERIGKPKATEDPDGLVDEEKVTSSALDEDTLGINIKTALPHYNLGEETTEVNNSKA